MAMAGEQHKLRHKAQAGFRHGFGTVHHLLVKRHLVAKHSRPGAPPLVVVQIDFEKAFDKVPREHLWLRLQERGFHGRLLDALVRARQGDHGRESQRVLRGAFRVSAGG